MSIVSVVQKRWMWKVVCVWGKAGSPSAAFTSHCDMCFLSKKAFFQEAVKRWPNHISYRPAQHIVHDKHNINQQHLPSSLFSKWLTVIMQDRLHLIECFWDDLCYISNPHFCCSWYALSNVIRGQFLLCTCQSQWVLLSEWYIMKTSRSILVVGTATSR